MRRKIYITPKSYIDLLSAYKRLLKRKHSEINDSKSKLSNGLYKLKEANELIEGLKEKLTELQPILDKKTIEIDEMIKHLTVEKKEASEVRFVVKEEEALVNE